MSEPDRIFAWWEYDIDHRAIQYWSEYYDKDQKGKFDYAEYVPSDPAVLAALPEVQALIAGAFEAAALACSAVIRDYDVMSPDGKTYLPIKTQKVAKGLVSIAREDIRALTPADAIAARDAMIAAEREACLAIISEYAEKDILKPASGWPDEEVRAWNNGGLDHLLAVAAAICKRGDG